MEENSREEKLDFVWIVKYIYSQKKFVAKVVGAMVLICILICLMKPVRFTASASILPVEEEQGILSNISGNMGALASLAGMDMKSKSQSIITADLYPKVAQSVPFLLELSEVDLPWKDAEEDMSFYEHFRRDTVMTLGKYLKAYTIDLPGTIMTAIKGKPVDPADMLKGEEKPYLVVGREKMICLKELSSMINVSEDPVYETVEISVVAESPEQASLLASKALDMIQETATEHKTRRAKAILSFVEERYKDAMVDYEDVYKKFSAYKDSHRDMVNERVGAEYQRLSDQFDLARSILNTLSSQLEQSRLAVMQNTPVFSVIEPVIMPDKKSSPKMALHLVAGVMLGLVFAVGFLVGQLAWWQVLDTEKIVELKNKI